MSGDGLFRVVLDPGHGGPDPGAVGNGIVEKDYAWALAVYIKARIEHSSEPISVTLTRTADTDPPFRARAAASRDADLVISLHCNASDSPQAKGAMTFCWPGNVVGRSVAEAIAAAVPEPLRRRRNAVVESTRDWSRVRAVLGLHLPPAVLVECGFLSNTHDAQSLLLPAVQSGLVVAVMVGIDRARQLAGQ